MRLFASLLSVFLLCVSLSPVLGADKTPRAKPIVLQTLEFLLIVPQSRDKLLAFSMESGDWSQTKVAGKPSAEALAKLQPTVSSAMGICPVGRDLYAYSSASGNWSRLRVPEEVKFSYSVGDYFVFAQIETEAGASQYYLFGKNSLEWSGVDLATGKLLTANSGKNE
ncbi:hypothetical protein F1728_10730 [Gimesia benthica]|uniref:Uncharacterized protein n=1 Tax=Gimesia benthica TaxID=2608982 RepID=A0A6I6AAI3_9PLAN|nr:hypothetical protein [Gimesia benthica]QGQ23116.1 hypothetical protein F1728_10730 [Gimesia benthica]